MTSKIKKREKSRGIQGEIITKSGKVKKKI
jgi:hypothetical protein